ncbi:MAG: DNA-processing protein DprA [Sutterellaceae bacterium]|nr:DNA-processing protein DprA [Sutterellaceae bacterium]
MTNELSLNTQAILLLTAPLIAGRRDKTPDLLTPGEYKRLAHRLLELRRQPSDLLSPDAGALLRDCASVIDENRLKELLGRGFLLSQAFERWQARSVWVVSRADADYPRRLKTLLREDAPAVLYGCGDRQLLKTGGLAMVGSRHVDEALTDYTIQIGRLAAQAGKTVVSGGAKGIDQAAMKGALEAGGYVCGILADSLEKAAMKAENRDPIREGRLVLVSPYDPNAGFNTGNAMQRNKLIYAFADCALVVNSDLQKGGTWAGALEQLKKYKFGPLFVRSTGAASKGLDALHALGAISWPNPQDAASFKDVFNVKMLVEPEQADLFATPKPDIPDFESLQPLVSAPVAESESKVEDSVVEQTDLKAQEKPSEAEKEMSTEGSPADVLYETVRKVMHALLTRPMSEDDVAETLQITKAQAKAWLSRMAEENLLDKQKRPVRYVNKV